MQQNTGKILAGLLVAGALALIAYTGAAPDAAPAPALPTPAKPVDPDCPDGKCPVKPTPRPKPWGEPLEAAVGGPTHADGTELLCDLPGELHQRNTGGSDGAGLCVFASMRHSGLWCDEPVFTELFGWMKKHPGGGYPTKVDQMIERYCKEKGVAKPAYLQVESNDIEVLKQACAAGLMPGVTYGRSPTGRYAGRPISHMVSLVHADDKHFVVLDNNYPGADAYEWLTPDEFRKAYGATSGKGWSVIPLKAGPPPVPVNSTQTKGVAMRPRNLFAAAFVAALALPNCPECSAAAPEVPVSTSTAVGYEWQPWPGGTECALMLDGRQVGAWNALRGQYRPIGPDGEWGKATAPPITPPAFDGGVDTSKLSPKVTYSLNGKPVDHAQAVKAIADAKIPDHKDKLRVTVIGPKAQTSPVLADLATSPKLAAYKDLVVSAEYEPTHWHVAKVGFETTGKPAIYVQDAAGTVLHRQDDYADGADGLAVALDRVSRLRKKQPDYDPKKDTDARRVLPGASGGALAPWAALAAIGAGVYFLTRPKKG